MDLGEFDLSVDHKPSSNVVVVVDGSVVGGSEVVVGGVVVVVVVGGLIGSVVVAVGCVVVVAVAVAVGCVVVVAGERVGGVVAGVGKRTEAGSVEIFGDLALDGAARSGDFRGVSVVELVVVGPGGGSVVVVVLVAMVVGGNLAEMSPTVWPCTSSGRSSWCTTTNKPATARTTAVAQLHCNSRRRPEVTVPTL
jgi:hypothetical protein